MPSLPRPLLVRRLKNEVARARKQSKHLILVDDPEFKEFPATLSITMRGAPGPVRRQGKVSTVDTHRLIVQVTKEYPYQKPIVQWMSDIFHPNIMTYTEGGFVCTRFIDNWSFESDLFTFLLGLEMILARPNPHSPYATCTCREAADYFLAKEEADAARPAKAP